MALNTAAKIGIGALVLWLGYEAFAPKPRFVGDRLKKNDRAVVDLSFMPELRTVLPPGAARVEVAVLREPSDKDSFAGELAGVLGPDGSSLAFVGLDALGERTFPRAAVVEIRRPRGGGRFERIAS